MSKEKSKDVDIFQRTLCCHPMREKEEEIEIFETESIELEAEEEIPIIEEEEKIDIKFVKQELECMKRRIQAIQLHLKHSTEECPEEECLDFEVLLNCSQNNEICALQKAQNKLQYQIRELIKCFKVAKEQILDLQLTMCEQNQEIIKMQESMKTLTEWKNTLQHEFGKCLERFEYLKHVKAEWRDVNEKLLEQDNLFNTLKELFTPQEYFRQEKQIIIRAINEIKEMFKELYQYQIERFPVWRKV